MVMPWQMGGNALVPNIFESRFQLFSMFADFTVSSLLDKISRAKLNLKPAYQVGESNTRSTFTFATTR